MPDLGKLNDIRNRPSRQVGTLGTSPLPEWLLCKQRGKWEEKPIGHPRSA